ncbi:MAG: guanylate kinase [Anaerolineae bacterium]
MSTLASNDSRAPAPAPHPLLVIVSGPSGVGKDVTLRRMKERGAPFHFLVTNTTRPKRPSEQEGVDYHFVTPEDFSVKLANNEFLEHAVVYGYQYGNSRREIESMLDQGYDVIMRIDVQGAATIQRRVEGAVFVFMTASMAQLEQHLRARRTESEEGLQKRLRMAAVEMQEMSKFEYVVQNREGELDRTASDIEAIIRAEKLRTYPRVVRFLGADK